jgi:hypothetical protein
MIGLSVAVGRFVEALFWAILKIAGSVAAAAVSGFIVLVALLILGHRAWTKRRR